MQEIACDPEEPRLGVGVGRVVAGASIEGNFERLRREFIGKIAADPALNISVDRIEMSVEDHRKAGGRPDRVGDFGAIGPQSSITMPIARCCKGGSPRGPSVLDTPRLDFLTAASREDRSARVSSGKQVAIRSSPKNQRSRKQPIPNRQSSQRQSPDSKYQLPDQSHRPKAPTTNTKAKEPSRHITSDEA